MTPIEKQIQKKIERIGIPLRDWDIQINFGIKTGFNEAFIIDTDTRDRLIQEDPRSAEVLRPILRGRDIKRYRNEFADLWLINTHNGIKKRNISPIDVNDYPAIKAHLDCYYTKLAKRGDKGNTPYNLRNCDYMEDFSKPKIIWGEISDRAKFMIDESGEYFTEATTFILTGYPHLKYLLAVLNSKVSEYSFGKIGTTTGMGTIRWKKYKILDFRLPQISVSQQMQFEDIVDTIIENRKFGHNTEELEGKINKMLYDIFCFKPNEIKYIEGL